MSVYAVLKDDNTKLFNEGVGRAIRQYREAAGLTRDQLAAELGVKGATVQKWEEGENACPAVAIWRMAHIFDCLTDELMPDVDESALFREAV